MEIEWIPIHQSYPEHLKEVLIAIQYSEIPIQAYWDNEYNVWIGSMEVRDWMKEGRCNDPALNVEGKLGAKVTHWCELPEPPKKI